MTTQQREELREVLIDYIQVLTSVGQPTMGLSPKIVSARIAKARTLLNEVA